jgi:hypothetical protein
VSEWEELSMMKRLVTYIVVLVDVDDYVVVVIVVYVVVNVNTILIPISREFLWGFRVNETPVYVRLGDWHGVWTVIKNPLAKVRRLSLVDWD